ncbi:MAG: rcc01693 family protein [Pseudomonadota bacterium]
MSERLDWPGLLRAGLYGLKLKPAEFWALSPIELMVMLGREGSAGALTRDGLEALLRDFPDRPLERPGGDDG